MYVCVFLHMYNRQENHNKLKHEGKIKRAMRDYSSRIFLRLLAAWGPEPRGSAVDNRGHLIPCREMWPVCRVVQGG